MHLKEIYKKSNYFQECYLFDNLYNYLFSFDTVESILKDLGSSKQLNKLNYIRFYKEGLEDYFQAEKVINFLNDENNGERVNQRILKAFGENSEFGLGSGIIINGGLQWSKDAAEKTILLSNDIKKIFGDVNFTIDLTIFIGAYKSTPFGVHIDDSSHRTILNNLGPEVKDIIVWENSDIESEFGKVLNIKNYKEIKSKGKKTIIKKGKSFVLPSMKYHIGLNEKLSTTIALVIDLIDDKKALKEEVKNITNENSEIEKNILNLTISDIIELNLKRNKSNSMIKYSILETINRETINEETNLNLNKNYSIEFFKNPSNSIVFINGHSFILKDDLSSKLINFNYPKIINFYELYKLIDNIFNDSNYSLKYIFFLIDSGAYGVLK